MAHIAGVQTKNDPLTGRLKTLVMDVPKLMKNPEVREALENLIDILVSSQVEIVG